MSRLDQATQIHYRIPACVLMENAGRSALEHCLPHLKKDSRVVFLIGNGNNGGDGLVMARHLYFFQDQTKHICIFILPEGQRSNNNLLNLTILKKLHLEVTTPSIPYLKKKLLESDWVIDALLGVGRKDEAVLRKPMDEWVDLVNHSKQKRNFKIVALDLPTGIDSYPQKNESEVRDHSIIKADQTFTYGLPKKAFYFPQNRPFCGKIEVINPGFPHEMIETVPSNQRVSCDPIQEKIIPYQMNDYKKTRGRVAVIAGSRGFLGAGYLSASAVQRSGSGLTTLYTFLEDYPHQVQRIPSSIMVKPISEFPTATEEHFDAMLIGPGWGKGISEERNAFLQKLMTQNIPIVIDADGLYFFKEKWIKQKLRTAIPLILTPHIKEMARLSNRDQKEVLRDPFKALELAEELNCFIVLKCHLIYLFTPTGKTIVFDDPNPYLGVGGSGDVLAGVISSLCGYYFGKEGVRGLATATELAIHIFQKAARSAQKKSRIFSPEMILEEIPQQIQF